MRKLLLVAVLGIVSFLTASTTSVLAQSASPAFRVSSKNSNSITLSFQLPAYEFTSEQLEGKSYSRIKLADSGFTRDLGMPELPVLSTRIAIPATGNVQIEALQVQQNMIAGFEAFPFQEDRESGGPKAINIDRDFYQRGSSYPETPVRYGDPEIIRGMRVITLQVSPFSYNPVTKELMVRSSIELKVNYTGGKGENELSSEPTRISSVFAPLLEASIVNFDDYRGAVVANTPPRILIVHGAFADQDFTPAMEAFVLWKKQKGAEVDVVSFTSPTTSTVKAEIQSRYNNLATRPDYIIIVGDTNGSFPIPTYTETYSSYGGEGDYPYTHLDGTDTLGDCFIGRISAENSSQLRNILNKTYLYERDLSISTASWLNRMLLVGDWDPSGISTIYINKYIKEYALEVNPDYTFTELYGAQPSYASINAALTMGVGVFNYRGWLGMSGWAPSADVMNNYKVPHCVNITCGTGTFENTTSTTEAFTRLGNEGAPAGAVTAIGMATSGTHTGYNNTLDGGIFAGLLTYGMRTMGEALLHGKLYLFETYGVTHTAGANYSAHWCNLIGDPSMEVYFGIPSTYQIVAPSSIPVGYSLLDVVVKNALGVPVEGQCVTLSFGSGILARAYTDEYGLAVLRLPSQISVGTGVITVSGHDYKPLQQNLSIVSSGIIPGLITISDDNIGSSIGNNDGLINAGERIELTFPLQNTGATHTRNVSGTVTCTSPFVAIMNPSISYGDILAGATASNASPLIVEIDPSCPDGTNIRLVLQLTSQGGIQYTISEHLLVYNGRMTLVSMLVIDGQNASLDPDEAAELRFVLSNSGSSVLSGLNAELVSDSRFINISNQTISYGTANPSQQVQPSGNFSVYINALCLPGMVIPADIRVYNNAGFEQFIPLSLTVGNVSVTDPLGPDAYGYVIYDIGDYSYPDKPVYAWMGIAPAEGGSGTLLPIDDVHNSGDEGDQISSSYTAQSLAVVNMPFNFSFYGIQYSQITVCSNGFIALGVTANAEFRNFRLPGAMGPSPMIAGFWDNLATGTNGKVYTYYDAANHRFIVEWYRMLNGFNGSSEETFQIILYDQAYVATSTGDGPILIQYQTFNNVDSAGTPNHGNYSTIGIQNHNQTIGLEYSFSNTYPTAAAPLNNLSALYITTVPVVVPGPNLTIKEITHNDSNGNGIVEPGESDSATIVLKNIGDTTANNVSATLSSSDPYITISNATVSYGSIAAFGTSSGTGTYQFSVSGACPQDHVLNLTLTISGSGSTWVLNFPSTAFMPIIGFGGITVNDTSGNFNGQLDPGETATITIPLNNTGGVNSSAGTATLTCGTEGITVLNGNAAFSAIGINSFASLSFSIRASSAMSIGTLASLVFNASAGVYTATASRTLEVGSPTEVNIGAGTSTQTYPLDRYYNYSAHEAIYMASEIGLGGSIRSIAYYKASGDDIEEIQPVSVYMKHTTLSAITTGVYSTAGYTLVYSGVFPNNASTGWMEVNLNNMFEYNGLQNLSILVVKGYQLYNNAYPRWHYSTTATNRVRQNHSDSAAPTSLTATNFLPNIKIKMFPDSSILFPPQSLVAQGSNRTVALTWQAPISGTPTSYNVYRNSLLLENVTEQSYYDISVTNGTTYSYYLKALYDTEESTATSTVQATPHSTAVASAVLGTGTTITAINNPSPINITYKSSHGQSVYTQAELNAAGVYGPINITQLGFYIVTAPNLALPNFIIRMKHTTATNASVWHTATDMQTVYTSASYMPTVGGYDMLTFSTPFTWNGTDNIVVDTAFGLVANWSQTGTIQYTTIASGYRYTWSDTADQTDVYSGNSTTSLRPNIRISVPAGVLGATISMPTTPLSFGAILVGATTTQQISIQNTGNQILAGYITCPAAYSIAVVRTANTKAGEELEHERDRTGYNFTVPEGTSKTFAITFAPTSVGSFSGNVVVTTNSTTNSVLNLPVSGSAIPATLATPVASVMHNGASVVVQWNTIPNANLYKVFKSNSPNGPFTLLGTTTQLQYTDVAADHGFYYVQASDTNPTRN